MAEVERSTIIQELGWDSESNGPIVTQTLRLRVAPPVGAAAANEIALDHDAQATIVPEHPPVTVTSPGGSAVPTELVEIYSLHYGEFLVQGQVATAAVNLNRAADRIAALSPME